MFPCSGRGRDIFLDIPLYRTGVGVEKLFPAKFAKIKSRQEALQTTFSVFLDIFYPPIFGYFEENGLFQHPRLIYKGECQGKYFSLDRKGEPFLDFQPLSAM